MSCSSVTKFVITKGLSNEFVFTIKQDGSTLPITINPLILLPQLLNYSLQEQLLQVFL